MEFNTEEKEEEDEEQEKEEEEVTLKQQYAANSCLSLIVFRRLVVSGTSGFGGLEKDPNQFRDIEVRSVVESIHVGPAAPQTDISAQRDELRAETQRGSWVTCTRQGTGIMMSGTPPLITRTD